MIKITPLEQSNKIIILRNKMIFFASSYHNTKFLLDWIEGRNELLKHLEVTLTIKWRTVIRMFRHRDKFGLEVCNKLFEALKVEDNSDDAETYSRMI